MYNVLFFYEDPKLNAVCENITSIEQCDSQWATFSGDELMNHRYNLHRDFYLRSNNSSYVISSKGLIGIEVRKV